MATYDASPAIEPHAHGTKTSLHLRKRKDSKKHKIRLFRYLVELFQHCPTEGIADSRDNITAMETRISKILAQLTLEEKVNLLSGSDFVAATGVPRLGIPAIGTVDSVNGVKGRAHINGTKTLCFPSTTCLGASWNVSLMREMGNELAVQAKFKCASVILGPTVNIQRDPRGGRNFEFFSEDPLLTGKMAASLINGIQEGGVAACPKHFVGNESEWKRRLYDVREPIEGRTMREIYLAAFQHLLRDSSPMAIMTAYNKLDGVYCSENPAIKKILRGEWNYSGCVMSDWYGTRSGLPSVEAGLDLEMPGPSVFRGQQLVDSVRRGLIEEGVVDESARNVLRLIHKTSSTHESGEERSVINDEANLLARRIASEGIVLLKNINGILPLPMKETGSKLAIIGAAALAPPIGGGGSVKCPAQYTQSPFECLRAAHPEQSHVQHSAGINQFTTIPALPISMCVSPKTGKQEIDVSYYQKGVCEPVIEESIPSTQVAMLGFIKPPLTQETFSHYIITTRVTPSTTGKHCIAMQATAPFVFFVNGNEVLQSDMQPQPSVEDFLFVPKALERKGTMHMTAGESYLFKVIVQPYHPVEETGEPRVHAAKLCFMEQYSPRMLLSAAVNIAHTSDVSIIFAGRDSEMESEGFDLETIKLPVNQEAMIKSVASASRKTVLVLYGGNPIDISSFDEDVDAILFAHFPGQEGSQAIVDILTGVTCPSGRLANTWPMKLEDVSTFDHFPAKKNKDGAFELRYKEGLKVGYRNTGYGIGSRFPFGYGLSYTTFKYDNMKCKIVPSKGGKVRDGELVISIDVSNTGSVAGYEVVQAFITDVESSVWRPREELKAFDKIWLEPGEKKTARMVVGIGVAMSFWDDTDEGEECWRAEAGEFRVRVNNWMERFVLKEGFVWKGL